MKYATHTALLALTMFMPAAVMGEAKPEPTAPEKVQAEHKVFPHTDAGTARHLARQLVDSVDKIPGMPIKIDAKFDKSVCISAGHAKGLVFTPQDGLNPKDEPEDIESNKGTSFGYLFLSKSITLKTDGKGITSDKVYESFCTIDKKKSSSQCILLSIRKIKQVDKEDFYLCAYGKDAKPLIETRFDVNKDAIEDMLGEHKKAPPFIQVRLENDQTTKDGSMILTLTISGAAKAMLHIGLVK